MKLIIRKIILQFIPLKLANYVSFFLLFFFKKKKSYSQFGEDLIINNFFKKLKYKTGFFVDIGAYHPSFISNTKILRNKGWNGAYVEADKTKCRLIKLFSKDFEVLNKAVSPSKTKKKFHFTNLIKFFQKLTLLALLKQKKNQLN